MTPGREKKRKKTKQGDIARTSLVDSEMQCPAPPAWKIAADWCCADALLPARTFRTDTSGPGRRSTATGARQARQGTASEPEEDTPPVIARYRARTGERRRFCICDGTHGRIFPVTNLRPSEISSSFQPLWNGTVGYWVGGGPRPGCGHPCLPRLLSTHYLRCTEVHSHTTLRRT